MSKTLFDPAAFGERVQVKVDLCGSLRAAEKKTGIDHATLSRIAKGKPPTIEHFFQLKRWLDGRVPKQ